MNCIRVSIYSKVGFRSSGCVNASPHLVGRAGQHHHLLALLQRLCAHRHRWMSYLCLCVKRDSCLHHASLWGLDPGGPQPETPPLLRCAHPKRPLPRTAVVRNGFAIVSPLFRPSLHQLIHPTWYTTSLPVSPVPPNTATVDMLMAFSLCHTMTDYIQRQLSKVLPKGHRISHQSAQLPSCPPRLTHLTSDPEGSGTGHDERRGGRRQQHGHRSSKDAHGQPCWRQGSLGQVRHTLPPLRGGAATPAYYDP